MRPSVELDKDTCNGAAYFKLTVAEPSEFDPYVSVNRRISRLLEWARLPLDEAESVLCEVWPGSRRATEAYWDLEYGVWLEGRWRKRQTS